MWQTLYRELSPLNLVIVTVALDLDREAARPWIEAAQPEHPSLIDQAHVVDELFGISNVPNGVWIDEEGVIIRPAEPAFARTGPTGPRPIPPNATPDLIERITLVNALRIDSATYLAALRDWARHGSASPFALSPDEVMRRSRPRRRDEAEAAAHFELGQHLHRVGRAEEAIPHFRAAHRLDPTNWTYKRQAWSLVDPAQGPTDFYDGDWVTDVRTTGPENYYPPLHMGNAWCRW